MFDINHEMLLGDSNYIGLDVHVWYMCEMDFLP